MTAFLPLILANSRLNIAFFYKIATNLIGLGSRLITVQSAYLHIPFCRRRCFYCDFPVKVVGDHRNGGNSLAIATYVELLCQEIRLTPNHGSPLKTIFLGGGTPSLLTASQVAQILTTLDQHWGIGPNPEISMEMDPGTFDRQQLQDFVNLGINRISLGVQAFQDPILQRLGRTHTRADIEQAVTWLQDCGVHNYSFDLISGLPDQTLSDWQFSLELAIALSPAHLSCYDLILEPGTAFNRQHDLGTLALPPDDVAADLYRLAQSLLTAHGYNHYEISNYARPGYQCQHNRVYWQRGNFYGLGMGAASYVNGDRLTRPRTTPAYRQWVEQAAPAYWAENWKQSETSVVPRADDQDAFSETLMLGLRLAEGLEWQSLASQFGEACLDPLWPSIQTFRHHGWLRIQTPEGEDWLGTTPKELSSQTRICLTDPEGFLFSNTVLSMFFSRLDNGER